MPKFTIVGAGQTGLQLAIHLLKKGREVLLVSNKTAEQLRTGSIMSTQGMFGTALTHEKTLDLNFFENWCPKNTHVNFCLAEKERPVKAINWIGATKSPFQAVDQRLKFSRWIDQYQQLGGKLMIRDVNAEDLNQLSQETDLLIIAAGKGEVSHIFPRDYEKSTHDKPRRVLSALYVHGMEKDMAPGIRATLLPEIGEYFCMSGLTFSGPCDMMLFEGIPGQAFDCWKKNDSPEAQLNLAKQLLKKYLPWEFERCEQIVLTDPKAVLIGQYTPVIKRPFVKLPSGRLALGVGDIVVLNDPISGQGANTASRAASFYAEEILKKDENSFDETWMLNTFNTFWHQQARWSTLLSDLLLSPPSPHMFKLLQEAQENSLIANTIAEAFENPASLFPWIFSPKLTYNFIEEAKRQKTAHFDALPTATIPSPKHML